MNKLTLKDVIVKKNRVEFDYSYNGLWNEIFNEDEKFSLEYDIDVSLTPKSILVIPFLCNVLPISWVFDLKIDAFEIDKTFFECIDELKNGYKNMFPNIAINGSIYCNNIIENKYESNKTGVLFSGGVDAFDTLLRHIDERPNLLTVWGADIKLDDVIGWEKVDSHHKKVAEQFNLEYNYIKSNLKTFINNKYLTKYIKHFVNDGWWHGFQHGIGILGLMAPIAYIKNLGTLYIASSFTAEYKGNYTCASDPTIDNYLRFANCKVIHDGYEFNRQDKIHNICCYANKHEKLKIPVRVCWKSTGGENCCNCEKCTRTIMGFLAEKNDPNNFGFKFDDIQRKKTMSHLIEYAKYNYNRYICIQKRLIQNYSLEETPKDLLKFRNLHIRQKKNIVVVLCNKIKKILK